MAVMSVMSAVKNASMNMAIEIGGGHGIAFLNGLNLLTLVNRHKKGTCFASAFFIRLMESGRVELPSALAPNLPVIHRFIRFDPHGGNY